MERKEYMDRLEQLLLVLPKEEREEALQYYTDYFDDAGVDNVDKVISDLGSPEEVAAKIRAGYFAEYGEYSEKGFEDTRFSSNQEMMVERNHSKNGWEDATTQYQDGWENRAEDQFQDNGAGKKDIGFRQNGNSQQTNIWKIIAIMLIVLIAAPIILPMGLALMAVLIALVVAALAIVFAIGLAGFAVCFAGGAIIVAGLTKVLLTPAVGILATGIGCLLLAIGVLLSWAIISVLVKIVPGMIRGIVKILGTPFRKAGVR